MSNKDVHEIFVQFSKDIAPNLGEYKGGKSEQQIIDLINREVVAELEATLKMNGVHPGDWEVAIKQRIAELNQRKSTND